MSHGNHFLHERPMSARSWKEPEMEELMADPRVHKVSGPMCVWKMLAEGENGEMGYVRVAKGHNALHLEEQCSWAVPAAFTESNYPCNEDGSNCKPN